MTITLQAFDWDVALHARRWRNDPTVNRWFRQVGPINDLQQREWFEKQSADPTVRMFAIENAYKNHGGGTTRALVGVCGLTSVDLVNRRAELSMYIDPDQSGSGYGKAAFEALFQFGFDDLGLYQIWCECFDENPVIGLLEKLGMRVDGTRRDFYFKGGKFINAHLMSILRSEWDDRRKHEAKV